MYCELNTVGFKNSTLTLLDSPPTCCCHLCRSEEGLSAALNVSQASSCMCAAGRSFPLTSCADVAFAKGPVAPD